MSGAKRSIKMKILQNIHGVNKILLAFLLLVLVIGCSSDDARNGELIGASVLDSDTVPEGRVANTVIAFDHVKLGNRKLYSFNGGGFFVTGEHPFMSKEGVWKSIDPQATLRENPQLVVEQLEIGDVLLTQDGEVEIKQIDFESADPETPLYNFVLGGNNTYYADGYLVHNKCSPSCAGAGGYCFNETFSDGCGGTCTGTKSGSCAAAGSYCFNETFSDGCGGSCTGTIPPDCSCASNTCYGSTCTDSNCGTSCAGIADCTPPSLTSSPQVFAALHNKSTTVTFADIHAGPRSGMASASITITGPTGTTSHSGVSVISVTRDFGAAGNYNLNWTATDNAGNSTSGNVSGFFHVVANVPEWNASGCTGNNYQTTCPSSLSFSAGTQVADSVDYHTVTAKLVDRYGNRVITESGIKSARVNFNFANSSDLDQIAGTGDSARYTSSEFSLADDPGGNNTSWLTEASGGNGEFELRVHSYAPTSGGYALISGAGINLDFTSLDYQVLNTGSYGSVGAIAANYAQSNAFAFSPALISTPTALNWNG
ncbi:MAG: Hint domain-containing protein, partial [Patescibacteria group bacterium]